MSLPPFLQLEKLMFMVTYSSKTHQILTMPLRFAHPDVFTSLHRLRDEAATSPAVWQCLCTQESQSHTFWLKIRWADGTSEALPWMITQGKNISIVWHKFLSSFSTPSWLFPLGLLLRGLLLVSQEKFSRASNVRTLRQRTWQLDKAGQFSLKS